MSLLNSYAIWNNKGGVGKSTITFHLAAQYAEAHPNRNVLVVDMCPQANASMMLLGGGTDGEAHAFEFSQEATPRTVVGYLATVLSQGPGAALPDWRKYVVSTSSYNRNMSDNIYLLCGDANLEPMAPLISERAGQAALIPSISPWKWVHLTLRTFLDNLSKRGDEEWIVFIDTNPSFSIYTEIAISSVSRLIVPVNSDDASRVATNAMFTLIHGADPPHPIYGQYTYASKAAKEAIERPKIHLVVGNRLTQYDGPATAFAAMSEATAQALYEAYQSDTSKFTKINGKILPPTKFRDTYSVPLRDFNTAGVVAAHLGIPLSRLTESTYDIHGRSVRVDARRVQECRSAVNDVVARI